MADKVNEANDQRSDAKNPNNESNKDAIDNRANQMNPNNKAHPSSRKK